MRKFLAGDPASSLPGNSKSWQSDAVTMNHTYIGHEYQDYQPVLSSSSIQSARLQLFDAESKTRKPINTEVLMQTLFDFRFMKNHSPAAVNIQSWSAQRTLRNA
jgi:hypothetical protein